MQSRLPRIQRNDCPMNVQLCGVPVRGSMCAVARQYRDGEQNGGDGQRGVAHETRTASPAGGRHPGQLRVFERRFPRQLLHCPGLRARKDKIFTPVVGLGGDRNS